AMRRHRASWRIRVIPALFACFVLGVATGWFLRGHPPTPAEASVQAANSPSDIRLKPEAAATSEIRLKPDATAPPEVRLEPNPTTDTSRTDHLRVPIDGMDLEPLKGQFSSRRGNHLHEAVDILAPRNTPVHAVTEGTIAKLFSSKAGGI